MNKFKEVFQFLEEYGGSNFILNTNNDNEERYNKIISLKDIAYESFWRDLFSQILPYLKDRQEKQLYKIGDYQNTGKICNSFYIQVKNNNMLNYGSNISVVAQKEKLSISIEYDNISENNIDTIKKHNKYILSLDKWMDYYNLNLDKYYMYYEDERENRKMKLQDFIENKKLKSFIEDKVKNEEKIKFIIGKEFDKDYVLSYKNFYLEIAQSINELNFLYERCE